MAFERPHGYSERAGTAAQRLRGDQSASEERLWQALRRHDFRIRRQAPIGSYVADFVCQAAKLVVEVDGGVHNLPEVQARDAERDAWFRSRGYDVMRVSAEEAYGCPVDVAQAIADRITSLLPRREKGRVEGVRADDEADGAVRRRRPSDRNTPDIVRSPTSPTLLP
jgi:very-short-patch-repair endonuclease